MSHSDPIGIPETLNPFVDENVCDATTNPVTGSSNEYVMCYRTKGHKGLHYDRHLGVFFALAPEYDISKE